MAVDPATIAALVNHFASEDQTRAQTIKQVGATNFGTTGSPGAVTARGAKSAGKITLTPAGAPQPSSADMVKNIAKGIPILGTFLTSPIPSWLGGKNGDSAIDQMTAAEGTSQTPQNLTQGILNVLSTGSYASGRFLKQIGTGIAANQQALADGSGVAADHSGNLFAPGAPLYSIPSFGNDIAAAARGVAEGFGARFNGEAPVTPGGDLKTIGATTGFGNFAGDAAKNLFGADKNVQTNVKNIAGGTLGTVGDVAFDPTTYLGGTGIVRGLSKAAEAGSTAAKGGTDALSVLRAAGQGFRTGQAEHLAELAAARAARSGEKLALKSGSTPIATATEQAMADSAAREAIIAGEKVPAMTAKVDNTVTEALKPDIIAPKTDILIPKTVEGATSGATKLPGDTATISDLLTKRGAAVQKLLPNLEGQTPVDAAKILHDALVPSTRPMVTPELGNAVQHALSGTTKVPEISAAVKAIKADPAGKAFLAGKIKVPGGPDLTVEQAITRSATKRITGGVLGGGTDPVAQAVTEALRVGAKAPATTAASLGAAIVAHGFGDKADIPSLFAQLATAKPGAEREAIVKNMFASTSPFKNFDDAMKGAAQGQVESSMMRSMLKALGINTKATKPETLRNMLGKQGALNWQEVKDNIPTTQEVLDDHGVSAETLTASKEVDPATTEADAAAQYDREVQESAGADPLKIEPRNTNTPQALTGKMISAGAHAAETQAAKDLPFAERYDNSAWLAVHSALINTMKHAANVKQLEGSARQEFMYSRYAEAIREVETHARSLGQQPQLQYGAEAKPLYVSFGQIYHGLPEDVIAPALFNLNHIMKDVKYGGDFSGGISVFPTTIGNGVRAAIDGGDAGMIRNVMAADDARNAFQRTAAGEHALDNLALAISNPEFITHMKALDDSQQILAVARATQDANAVVQPAATEIIGKVARVNGDRADMVKAVNKATKSVKNMAPAEAKSMTRDVASGRIDNGIVGTIDQPGAAMVRADARIGVPQPGALERAAQRFAANKNSKGERIVAQVPRGTSESDKILQGETARQNNLFADDMSNLADQDAQGLIDDGYYEETDLGRIDASMDLANQSGLARVFARVNRAFNGAAAQRDVADLRVRAVTAARNAQTGYEQRLRDFLWGGQTRAPGFFGKPVSATDSIIPTIQRELGMASAPSDAEVGQVLANVWSAITVAEKGAGKRLDDAELTTALQAGASGIGRKGIGGAAPLSQDLTDVALRFRALKDEIFHPEGGPLARVGVSSKDLLRELEHYGAGNGGPLSDFGALDVGAVRDLATIDQGYDFATMESPLDVLNTWYKALAASSVRPSIGSGLSWMMDHRAENLSPAQARAAGWFRVNTKTEGGGINAYIDPESYFPKDLQPQMASVNRFLAEMEKPMNPVMAKIFHISDPITNVWKQGVTSINPRHHVSNILGDFGMNALDGVSPLYGAKAIRAMHDLRMIGETDMMPVDQHLNELEGMAAGTVKPSFRSSGSTALIGRGGVYTKVSFSPQEIWELGQRSGAFVNDKDAMDVVSQIGGKSHVLARPNPLMAAERGISDFSAARDNLPRLAHFMAILERGHYSSVEEAVRVATAHVNKFHPTIASLSPFEQKVARRTLMFYSWSRQALGAVLTTSLEHPAYVTLPSKFQYEVASNAGFNPNSIGDPNGNDPRIPSYEQNSVYGATFEAGLTPTSDPLSAPGGVPHLWGISLSTPQLDAMTSFFGGVNADRAQGPLQGFVQGLAGQINPLAKAGVEFSTDTSIDGIGKKPSADYAKWLLNSSGVGGTIGNLTGFTNSKPVNTPAENDAAKQRALLNWLTGLKATDYTSATAAAVAHTEQGAVQTKQLQQEGYTPAQITLIKRGTK